MRMVAANKTTGSLLLNLNARNWNIDRWFNTILRIPQRIPRFATTGELRQTPECGRGDLHRSNKPKRAAHATHAPRSQPAPKVLFSQYEPQSFCGTPPTPSSDIKPGDARGGDSNIPGKLELQDLKKNYTRPAHLLSLDQ